MSQTLMPHTDHDDLAKSSASQQDGAAEILAADGGLPERMGLPQQRHTQGLRHNAAAQISRQIGNQAFIRRFINTVQREDLPSGAGDAQQQGATASPVDTPEERRKRAIKGALQGSHPPMKIATEMCADPTSSGSAQGNADQVLGVTGAVSKALTDAKNTQ